MIADDHGNNRGKTMAIPKDKKPKGGFGRSAEPSTPGGVTAYDRQISDLKTQIEGLKNTLQSVQQGNLGGQEQLKANVPESSFWTGTPGYGEQYFMHSPQTVASQGRLRQAIEPRLMEILGSMNQPNYALMGDIMGDPEGGYSDMLAPLFQALLQQNSGGIANWLQGKFGGAGAPVPASQPMAQSVPMQDVAPGVSVPQSWPAENVAELQKQIRLEEQKRQRQALNPRSSGGYTNNPQSGVDYYPQDR